MTSPPPPDPDPGQYDPTRRAHGLFQQLPTTWKKEEKKPDPDRLRQRIAQMYDRRRNV